jgi:hypothetical protein
MSKKLDQKARKAKFIKDLCDSILNEKRTFYMGNWCTRDDHGIATCGTASCIAGHIEAIRRPLAKKLVVTDKSLLFSGMVCHASLAEKIYIEETGERCPLDFLARRHPRGINGVTRRTAVAHVKGTSKVWPQL